MARKASKSSQKLALVTGASRGLGLAIARELSTRGFRTILVGRDECALAKVAASIQNAETVACDIRDPQAVAALARVVGRRKLSVLINNAGIAGPTADVTKLDFATWRDVIETNLHGTFLVTQTLLTKLGKGSVVLNNLSIAAREVFPGMAAYSTSKRGLAAFTDVLREELRPKGIRVVAMLPGAVDTAIWQQFWPTANRRGMMRPETIARLVAEAVTIPEEACLEELVIRPTKGSL